MVACGARHSMALCQDGKVYAWGAGGSGQLAVCPERLTEQEGEAHSPTPLLVENLCKARATIYFWFTSAYVLSPMICMGSS